MDDEVGGAQQKTDFDIIGAVHDEQNPCRGGPPVGQTAL
jgi:hypothetical protein